MIQWYYLSFITNENKNGPNTAPRGISIIHESVVLFVVYKQWNGPNTPPCGIFYIAVRESRNNQIYFSFYNGMLDLFFLSFIVLILLVNFGKSDHQLVEKKIHF